MVSNNTKYSLVIVYLYKCKLMYLLTVCVGEKVIIILVDDLAFTIPSIKENEKTFLLSVMN